MKAFTFAALGWLIILFGKLSASGDMPAGVLLSAFFFMAAVISAILGLGGNQQRVWNVVALLLCIPFLLAVAAILVGGLSLGS